MIFFVVGTRPEVIKLAPLIVKFQPDERYVAWTGQHYDEVLTKAVWQTLPHFEFDSMFSVCGEDEIERLSCMMVHLHCIIAKVRPKWVVVQGDTTSALAGALAANKAGAKVWHVEAGARSFDPRQPEESNRKVIDHLSSGWGYSYPCDGRNLKAEGIGRGIHTGDILIDALRLDGHQGGVHDLGLLPRGEGKHILATIHRAETLADEAAVRRIAAGLRGIVEHECPVIFLRHPHTEQVMTDEMLEDVDVREPVSPTRFRDLLRMARAFITDSGGGCVEAAYLGVPCLVARDHTEYWDLVQAGFIHIGGTHPRRLADVLHCDLNMVPDRKAVDASWMGEASLRTYRALSA